MTNRRFLTGCLALATALWLPAAAGQAPTPIPRSPAPPPGVAPPVLLPAPSPVLPSAPPVVAPSPADRAAYESSRSAPRSYSFEDDTVEGDLARPEAPAAAAAPPEVPAYSDLCKASPKPPWCSDAPRGNGN
jgi:hypothetical protein